MGATRHPQSIVDITAGRVGHVKFPPKFTRIGHSEGPDFVTCDGDFLGREPAETGIGEVCIGAKGEHVARAWAI